MPKKRNHYATSLAADWAFPVPLAEGEPSSKESLSDEAEAQRPDHVSNARPASPLVTTYSAKKATRYKKVFPSSWIDPQSSPSTVEETAHTQIINSQVQPKTHPIHYDYLRTENNERRMGRPKRLDGDASVPTAGNSRYTPPPAPTHERVRFPFHDVDPQYGAPRNVPSYMTDRRVRGSSLPKSSETRLLRERSMERSLQLRDHEARHFPVYPHDTHAHFSAISPPVSVGQQSSEATTSPFQGRDLPANCPSVSPTYSIF